MPSSKMSANSIMIANLARNCRRDHCIGLLPVSFTMDAILARCASIAAENSAGVLALAIWPIAARRSARTGSVATERTSAAIRSRRSVGVSRPPKNPHSPSNASSG